MYCKSNDPYSWYINILETIFKQIKIPVIGLREPNNKELTRVIFYLKKQRKSTILMLCSWNNDLKDSINTNLTENNNIHIVFEYSMVGRK